MKLIWIHDQSTGELTCTINSELSYMTPDGGQTFVKTYKGVITNFSDTYDNQGVDQWEVEKHWISDNFSQIVGKYSPQWDITEESWARDNPEYNGALPLFGLDETGDYLDKLMRPGSLQEGRDMENVHWDDVKRIMVEVDTDGNYWQRLWCEYNNSFYNVQPCCVFPDNPGRLALTQEQVQLLLDQEKNS